MTATMLMVELTMAERRRDADDARLASLARRFRECCREGVVSSIVRALRTSADACCPTEAERLTRTRAVIGM